MIKVVTNNNLMIDESRVVVLDFFAEWCMPCKQLSKVIDEVDNDNIEIHKINIEDNEDLCEKYNVRGLPTLIIIKDGKSEVLTGSISKSTLLNKL